MLGKALLLRNFTTCVLHTENSLIDHPTAHFLVAPSDSDSSDSSDATVLFDGCVWAVAGTIFFGFVEGHEQQQGAVSLLDLDFGIACVLALHGILEWHWLGARLKGCRRLAAGNMTSGAGFRS